MPHLGLPLISRMKGLKECLKTFGDAHRFLVLNLTQKGVFIIITNELYNNY